MKVSINCLNTFILGCGQVWLWTDQIGPWLLYGSIYKLLKYFHSWLWPSLVMDRPDRPVAVYMKVSISYLNTFILGCGPSLVMNRPDRPVAVVVNFEEFGFSDENQGFVCRNALLIEPHKCMESRAMMILL